MPCSESQGEQDSASSAAQIRKSFASERSHSMLDPPGFQSQRQRILKQQSTAGTTSGSHPMDFPPARPTSSQTVIRNATETLVTKFITEQSSQEDDEKSDSSELSGTLLSKTIRSHSLTIELILIL
jgi:hypothetical protein